MYYNGKRDFYFKQYGIPILTLAFSVFLVGSGVYVYWASSTSHTSENATVIASNELKDVEQQMPTTNNFLGKHLESLTSLEKSDEGTITEVKENGVLLFTLEDKQVEINLLGVNTTEPSEELLSKLKEDLLNKKVKLSFEDERVVNDKVYAYVYLNDSLYNEKIVESGLAKINTDSKNLAYQDDLIQAQAYAKQLARGIWKR